MYEAIGKKQKKKEKTKTESEKKIWTDVRNAFSGRIDWWLSRNWKLKTEKEIKRHHA